ncbi:MAG: ABC transporter permease [Balneolaceae bacterium]
MIQIILYNLDIAIEAIKQNKLRSLLTSLGIIFGVASVIAMLAIGRGAQQEVLVNMQVLGTNNVIIQPVVEQREGDVEESEESAGGNRRQRRYTPGLTLEDIDSIVEYVPNVESASPEIIYDTQIIRAGRMRTGKLVGVNGNYFDINNFDVVSGSNFTEEHFSESMPVVIIGHGIRTRFFSGEDPIGQRIKAGNVWFKVVGVLQEKNLSVSQIENLGIRDYNMDVFAPATSVLMRYGNRAVITPRDIQEESASSGGVVVFSGGMISAAGGQGVDQGDGNYNQLDRIIVRVSDSNYSVSIAELISRMLQRRHNDVVDFEIIVPELLLQQEQRTKRIFNIVLASIASISLIVGGIGIMNIMLASVVERYREIGVRRAVGAKQQDIKLQFLTEALTISVTGGFIGILLGIGLSYVVEITAGILSIVTISSILISFGVATAIGIIFGYFPAQRAAQHNPVEGLRHE